MPVRLDPEQRRLNARERGAWQTWGPYLAERAWGTVREDYSFDGDAWQYFPHDHARSRTYRWNEDGLAGWCDQDQRLCLGLALWNGHDPFLKERLFGLSGHEGNHGEDVKELYWYTDATPSNSYASMRYWYPHQRFPYEELVHTNAASNRMEPEFEIADTGVFDDNRFFDVEVQYAKASPTDTLMRITVYNRADVVATVHVVPQLWLRNTWSWRKPADPEVCGTMDASETDETVASDALNTCTERPRLTLVDEGHLLAWHPDLGDYHGYWQGQATALFTDNETNHERLHDGATNTPYAKDGLHRAIVDQEATAVNPEATGTKVGVYYRLRLPAGGRRTLQLRLSKVPHDRPFAGFGPLFDRRRREADQFYTALQPSGVDATRLQIYRQALAGMLWTRQYFHYDVTRWQQGDTGVPVTRKHTRNAHWQHVRAADVLSMPDTWEYPWFAVWDSAFHCLPLAMLDPALAREQLLLFTDERYQHPNGQLPAYEWAFDDVNPPVHAWAALQVYRLSCSADAIAVGKASPHEPNRQFLEQIFHKLLINFTWWVNRKDSFGHDIFEGGFLGLDNISLFDRSEEPPEGTHLSQADATGWMGFFCSNMIDIALELARRNAAYESIACKFLEHYLRIASAIQGDRDHPGLWDPVDGFFHDHLNGAGGHVSPIRARSLVGLLPLIACTRIEADAVARLPRFKARLEAASRQTGTGFLRRGRGSLAGEPVPATQADAYANGLANGDDWFLSFASEQQLDTVIQAMLSEKEFLSPHGIRSLSRVHLGAPCSYTTANGETLTLSYEPGDGQSNLFGGNSNWRGPIWFPVNTLLIDALRDYGDWLGDDHVVQLPTGTGHTLPLSKATNELAARLVSLFLNDERGHAPWCGTDRCQIQAQHEGLHLFHEFFDGDTGRGLGASHQTGWTGLVAWLIQRLEIRQGD